MRLSKNEIIKPKVMLMNRLRELREDKDLRQSDIAALLNMTHNGYSMYENEKREIPKESLIKLARFYNTSIDYILYLTDERKSYPRSIIEDEKN